MIPTWCILWYTLILLRLPPASARGSILRTCGNSTNKLLILTFRTAVPFFLGTNNSNFK